MKYTRIRLAVKEYSGEIGTRIIDHKHESSAFNDERYIQKYYNSVVNEYRKHGIDVIKHSIKVITEDEYAEYATNNPWGWLAP